jgi:RNA polymerase sigma-70 factor, ECF subfamily
VVETGQHKSMLDRLRAGSAEALTWAYHEYAEGLYAISLAVTGCPVEAEDVLHDVFVGLPEATRKYRGNCDFEHWLKVVTARTAMMHNRRRRRRRELPLEKLDRLARRAAEDFTDPLLVRLCLEEALAYLTDEMRIIYILKDVEGYTHDEIAAFLDIRPNTSQVRLYRARKQLAELLGE